MTSPAVPETREAPHDLDAERSVLASMMLERAAVSRVRDLLPTAAFYRVGHQLIARAILALDERGEIADRITLAGELRSRGEFDLVGGHETLGAILDMATTTANLEQHLQQIRRAYSLRRARDEARGLLGRIEAGINGGSTISEVIGATGARMREIADTVEPGARPPSLEEQVLDGSALFDDRQPAAADLIGSGYFVAGGFSVIASMPGFGKTWLGLQAMRALATGEPWLDYHATRGRSLMVQLEMPRYSVRERLARVRHDVEAHTYFLVMPEGLRSFDREVDALSSLIDRRKVALMVLDPLHQLVPAINFDEDVDPFLSAVKKLRARTGVHICLLHHVNKFEFDKNASMRTNVLVSVKGSGRLTGDPDTVIGLIERHGQLRLVNAKTRLGPSVESIAIRQDSETGWFHRTATPEEVSESTDKKLAACLRVYGASGATLDQICEECGMSSTTARRHLEELGAVKLGGGRRGRGQVARYYFPSDAPQETIGENFEPSESPEHPW